jgi:hypothetical protein
VTVVTRPPREGPTRRYFSPLKSAGSTFAIIGAMAGFSAWAAGAGFAAGAAGRGACVCAVARAVAEATAAATKNLEQFRIRTL